MLSNHFDQTEFEAHGPVPPESVELLTEFCRRVLDPIRDRWGALLITSGYRPPEYNAGTGGAAASFHIYTADRCAADFILAGGYGPGSLHLIFEWLCDESGLLFDKAILEFDPCSGYPACIHVQYSRQPRRLAYTGQTHGTSGYTSVPVLAV